jgi:hypothetical protein
MINQVEEDGGEYSQFHPESPEHLHPINVDFLVLFFFAKNVCVIDFIMTR